MKLARLYAQTHIEKKRIKFKSLKTIDTHIQLPFGYFTNVTVWSFISVRKGKITGRLES